jgi:hypothetical protein
MRSVLSLIVFLLVFKSVQQGAHRVHVQCPACAGQVRWILVARTFTRSARVVQVTEPMMRPGTAVGT